MGQAEIVEKVREFITANFYIPDPASLDGDTSLVEQGLVDSTGVLEIVGFLEEAFSVGVEDEEMIPENFDSIHRIAAFVGRKAGGTAS